METQQLPVQAHETVRPEVLDEHDLEAITGGFPLHPDPSAFTANDVSADCSQ